MDKDAQIAMLLSQSRKLAQHSHELFQALWDIQVKATSAMAIADDRQFTELATLRLMVDAVESFFNVYFGHRDDPNSEYWLLEYRHRYVLGWKLLEGGVLSLEEKEKFSKGGDL